MNVQVPECLSTGCEAAQSYLQNFRASVTLCPSLGCCGMQEPESYMSLSRKLIWLKPDLSFNKKTPKQKKSWAELS